MANHSIDEELKLFEKEKGRLKGYAMETVALYAIIKGCEMAQDKCDKVSLLLKNVGKEVAANGYSRDVYGSAIDEEIERHDVESICKYGFSSEDVFKEMGDIWVEESEI